VKLRGNAKREVHVQGVVVSGEGLCLRSTSEGHEDRSLHFEIAEAVKIAAESERETERETERYTETCGWIG
jgi:hypothetical protein